MSLIIPYEKELDDNSEDFYEDSTDYNHDDFDDKCYVGYYKKKHKHKSKKHKRKKKERKRNKQEVTVMSKKDFFVPEIIDEKDGKCSLSTKTDSKGKLPTFGINKSKNVKIKVKSLDKVKDALESFSFLEDDNDDEKITTGMNVLAKFQDKGYNVNIAVDSSHNLTIEIDDD